MNDGCVCYNAIFDWYMGFDSVVVMMKKKGTKGVHEHATYHVVFLFLPFLSQSLQQVSLSFRSRFSTPG